MGDVLCGDKIIRLRHGAALKVMSRVTNRKISRGFLVPCSEIKTAIS